MVELVKAVVVSVSSCSDEATGEADVIFQTVGVTNVQPPSHTGSRKLGGRPLFRFSMGSPVLVNRIGFTRVSSSGAGERDILATLGDTEEFLGGGSDSRR